MNEPEYPFTVSRLPEEEGGGYWIEFPDFPGCVSDGETESEAIENGKDALASVIQVMREDNEPIPPPLYSGEWRIRAPRSLHRRLAERARREGVSMNTLVVSLLSEGLGHRA